MDPEELKVKVEILEAFLLGDERVIFALLGLLVNSVEQIFHISVF
jgi:hypothetical protein